MSNQLEAAIEAVKECEYSFCKFISPNDAGDTGGHQGGLYIPKNSIKLLFDEPGIKGNNKEKLSTINWFDGTVADARFIYYGKGSRNEYRITRLDKHFNVDDLVIISKKNENEYLGFRLVDETEIDSFLKEVNLNKEDTNSLIKYENQILESSKHSFKPRARIIKTIGLELISNDVIALVELIKNSYDADALQIEIELNNIFSNNGEIIIKDSGLGMSYEKIINVWLEPATPDKRNDSDKHFSTCFRRRLLGEKGIGRFAAHRLGNSIEMVTRAKKDFSTAPLDYETVVQIDWNSFTEDKYLDEIPIIVKRRKPQIFIGGSGTLIKITNITPWKNFASVREAVIKIRGLESPVKPERIIFHEEKDTTDPGIEINISSDDIKLNTELGELKNLASVLDTAFYKFTAIIGEDGSILYNYTFDRIDYHDIKRETKDPVLSNLTLYDVNWFEEHPINKLNAPGEFEVSFYAWDLDTAALKVAGLADYYKNIIKPNSGVRIYRDNFRVWPYGEPDNDWLELDATRLNAPKERPVSRNQIFGIVHVSSTHNSSLKDQSNREGLIINEQYEQFYRLVRASLKLFATERKADKIKIDTVATKKTSVDIVTDNINELRNRIAENSHTELYKKSVDIIEESYQGKINDILERYMMAAAIGISYSIPIHEMKLRLSSIKHVIEDIERNASLEDKYLRELAKQLNDTEDIIKAVSSIMSKQKKQKVSLLKVANNIRLLKEADLEKYFIEYEIIGDKDIEVEAVPGLLNTSVLNLVDNAIYWLRANKIAHRQKKEEFKAKITLEIGRNMDNKFFLKVIDNGPGFSDPFELLTEPYYSKKTDGLGLGLYLVNEIMIRLGGHLIGYNSDGATIEMIF